MSARDDIRQRRRRRLRQERRPWRINTLLRTFNRGLLSPDAVYAFIHWSEPVHHDDAVAAQVLGIPALSDVRWGYPPVFQTMPGSIKHHPPLGGKFVEIP